jgi:hypothetical protein
MRKRDKLEVIHTMLMDQYGYEIGSTMFLYMMQKKQGLTYGESNKMLDQELTFLRNAPKRQSSIGTSFGI